MPSSAPPLPKSEKLDTRPVLSPISTAARERSDDEESYRPISMAMLWRLFTWLKPYRRLYLFGALCGVLAVLLDLSVPWIQRRLIDHAIPSGDMRQVLEWIGLWVVLVGMSLLFDALQLGATNRCGERVIMDLRMAVFAQLQRLSMGYFDKTKLGRIITRGTSDMDALRAPVISGINQVALNMLLMTGSAVMILVTDWRIFLAVVWLAPVLSTANHFYRKRLGERQQVVREGYSRVASNLAENVTGVRVVSAFNREDENLERFNQLQQENTYNNVMSAHTAGMYEPFLEFIRFSGEVIVLAYGGVLVLRGELLAGQVVAAYYYWTHFMTPAKAMGDLYSKLMTAMASSERIFALLDMQPDVQDRPTAQPLPRLKGDIAFEGVTFGYDPRRPVLHDINLKIPAGKTYALVGATGSGKSSTLSLLARFYELQQGRILVDGTDIRDATTQSLHKQMGLVLQVNYLFTGTIMENIRYPRPDATDADVINAAKALGIHDTFEALPEGYNTLVGERGSTVSLGLRQLICFTRVLLANPSIFLLDEATSSIDTVTEVKVQAALEQLVKGRTTVIVAHRLSTIVKADCIVVLAHGRIVEQGAHNELLALNGQYAMLYRKFISQHQPPSEGPVLK